MIFVSWPISVFWYFKTELILYWRTVRKEGLTIENNGWMLSFNQRSSTEASLISLPFLPPQKRVRGWILLSILQLAFWGFKSHFWNCQLGVFMCTEFESSFWHGMWDFVSFWCEALGTMEKCEWTFHEDCTLLIYEMKQKCVTISALLYADLNKFWLSFDQCGVSAPV